MRSQGITGRICRPWRVALLMVLAGWLAGCGRVVIPPPAASAGVAVETVVRSLRSTNTACAGHFVAHELDHETTVPGGDTVRMFEANGAGVAINDLDGDGDLDVVLANHAGSNTLLWNEGNLQFRTQRLSHGDSRAVAIVDVDGDGRLDIVFTRRVSAPNYWHNEGNRRFSLQVLPNVSQPLYSMNWADLDGDHDLDFVGGTYDAGLLTERGHDFLMSGQAGVYYYENTGSGFAVTRLASEAQALALLLFDINRDGRLDIVVGNDFAVPDQVWFRTATGWEAAQPFQTMSHSTMSLDAGDIDNDGRPELFSTDMMPYAEDPDTLAAWHPVMAAMMEAPHPAGDPQVMANVLQVLQPDGTYVDMAGQWQAQATGWSWSSKFGDLDQDGFLDLYVVNGMMEFTTFAHLPDHELVEENQALRNDGHGRFVPMPAWRLSSTHSGRGMSMGDLDGDGDLDIVVNNLRAPAQLFENQLCQGQSLVVDLFWPRSRNTRAVGATLILHTRDGRMQRTVQALSGYLSGDPAQIHFGFPAHTELEQLEIRWPDGKISWVKNPPGSAHLEIHRRDES